jgi:hypothetical protein
MRTSPVSFSVKKIRPSRAKAMFVGKARFVATGSVEGCAVTGVAASATIANETRAVSARAAMVGESTQRCCYK